MSNWDTNNLFSCLVKSWRSASKSAALASSGKCCSGLGGDIQSCQLTRIYAELIKDDATVMASASTSFSLWGTPHPTGMFCDQSALKCQCVPAEEPESPPRKKRPATSHARSAPAAPAAAPGSLPAAPGGRLIDTGTVIQRVSGSLRGAIAMCPSYIRAQRYDSSCATIRLDALVTPHRHRDRNPTGKRLVMWSPSQCARHIPVLSCITVYVQQQGLTPR